MTNSTQRKRTTNQIELIKHSRNGPIKENQIFSQCHSGKYYFLVLCFYFSDQKNEIKLRNWIETERDETSTKILFRRFDDGISIEFINVCLCVFVSRSTKRECFFSKFDFISIKTKRKQKSMIFYGLKTKCFRAVGPSRGPAQLIRIRISISTGARFHDSVRGDGMLVDDAQCRN